MRLSICSFLLLISALSALNAQDYSTTPWSASWIAHPTAPASDFSVVHFRRNFELRTLPDSLPVHVSADNRYQLYVNGRRVGEGPARGDLQHWRYETYDLRKYLRKGDNVIAAMVWNYGIDRPWSQQSYRSAFILQPRDEAFAKLRTGTEYWKVFYNESYAPITGARERLGSYIVAGPQLRIDGNRFPWGWEHERYDDTAWATPIPITRGMPRGLGTEYYWGLVPRQIPALNRTELAVPKLVTPDEARVPFRGPRRIAANTTVRYLLDFGRVENMFLTLGVSGAEDARIKITYAESLFHEDGTKGHRDKTAGKQVRGVYDLIVPAYDEHQPASNSRLTYTTPWFRTSRYVELEVQAGPTGVTLSDLLAEGFAYPFAVVGSFTTPYRSSRIPEIWDVAWQTARMCAQETYVDCPYYEQLQYVGDTRIQALISLYVSGDDRLMRKAIELFDQSRTSEGLTQSRYPSSVPQVIPPYSLSWIEMVGDYWMHRPDSTFVRRMLPGVRGVLDWYDAQLLENGLVGPTEHWNFVDWTPAWPWNDALRVGGVPEMAGGSSIISLQLLSALRRAEEMSRYFGDGHQAAVYKDRADRLSVALVDHCWQPGRGLFSDTPAGRSYSQHANILALLTGIAPATAPEELRTNPNWRYAWNREVLEKVLTDTTLTQVSEYFRFYLIQALYATGTAHLYPDQLKVWAAHLDNGLTTFPEKPGETRSDCHAWSASPNYDLLATLAGIRPAEPGFRSVSVRPVPVDFDYEAVAAHPAGKIEVRSRRSAGERYYTVTLPAGVTGRFASDGYETSLRSGKNNITISN